MLNIREKKTENRRNPQSATQQLFFYNQKGLEPRRDGR